MLRNLKTIQDDARQTLIDPHQDGLDKVPWKRDGEQLREKTLFDTEFGLTIIDEVHDARLPNRLHVGLRRCVINSAATIAMTATPLQTSPTVRICQ